MLSNLIDWANCKHQANCKVYITSWSSSRLNGTVWAINNQLSAGGGGAGVERECRMGVWIRISMIYANQGNGFVFN